MLSILELQQINLRSFLYSKTVLHFRRIYQSIILGTLITIVSFSFNLNLALANTIRTSFTVNDDQRETASNPSVLLTTDKGEEIEIHFENPIRPGETDVVSLTDRQVNVVKAKFQWKHTVSTTFFVEREARPGKYFTLCDLDLRNLRVEDRNVAILTREKDLEEGPVKDLEGGKKQKNTINLDQKF